MYVPPPTRKRAARLGAASLVLLAAAGCSSAGGGGERTAFDATITTDVPAPTKDVDSITWNLPSGEPATLDPAQSALENISTVVGNMCEGLMRFDPDYGLQPALAESMEHPDDLTYIFKLRQGATFWDGTPVTSADVVFSIDRILDPSLASPWIAWSGNLASVVATDDATVTLTLSAPDPLVENFFALPAFTVVEKAFTEQAGSSFGTAGTGVMCSGPYRFTSWTPGQEIVLDRNPDWWNASDAPHVEQATFTFVTDAAAREASLRSGETDGSFSIQPSSYDQLSASGNLLFGPSLSPTFIDPLNLDGPLGDPDVRAALASAIDYAGIAQSVYRGAATPLKALVPPAAYGYATDTYQAAYDALPEPAQDLDAVRSIVAENPTAAQTITLAYISTSDEESRVATAIADAANQAGMDVQLRPLSAADYGAAFGSPQARVGLDAFIVTGYLDFPEPAQYYQFFSTASYYNYAGYSDPAYDAAIGEALSTVDDQARAELVIEAQQLLMDKHAVIPLVTSATSVYYGSDLTGLVPRQNYLYTPWLTELGGK